VWKQDSKMQHIADGSTTQLRDKLTGELLIVDC
jgi:hypothetical protein